MTMPMTTIKVERAVRDRFAEVARARGTTMGSLLEAESRRLEAEQRWADIESSYQQMRVDDPAGWEDYLRELDTWDAGTAGTDDAAAAEWPEYNRPA